MTDRESIVAMLRKQAKEAHELATKPCDADGRLSLLSLVAAAETLADQIERCDDLKPAKPKATIADLLALHDLDLGALAHKTSVTGEDLATAQVEMLCDGFTADRDALTTMVREAIIANDSPLVSESAQNVAAIGAKVRAALPTPRILQSADEAPCGSLMRCKNNSLLLRLWDGTGWVLGSTGALIYADNGWLWSDLDWVRGASLIVEGLTEAECRHLSSLSAADALVWCEARDKACATHDAAVIDRLQRDGDSLRSLLAVIRHALGAGDHDDIVKHARAIKARADRA